MTPLAPATIPAAAAQPRWLWHLPRIAPVLALVATAILLWYLHRNEIEEQRATLISDVLWVEQNIRFQMERNVEQLGQLGQDAIGGTLDATTHEARTAALMRNSQGIQRVMLIDATGRPIRTSPPLPEAATRVAGLADAIAIATRLARPTYGPVRGGGNDAEFAVVVPLFSRQNYAGTMVGVYSLRTLLAETVPWLLTFIQN